MIIEFLVQCAAVFTSYEILQPRNVQLKSSGIMRLTNNMERMNLSGTSQDSLHRGSAYTTVIVLCPSRIRPRDPSPRGLLRRTQSYSNLLR